jgi:hypothetical protein
LADSSVASEAVCVLENGVLRGLLRANLQNSTPEGKLGTYRVGERKREGTKGAQRFVLPLSESAALLVVLGATLTETIETGGGSLAVSTVEIHGALMRKCRESDVFGKTSVVCTGKMTIPYRL